ncbi:MAG: hypothetical protein PHN72_06875 [Bacilli bacterium]|nr:hypothetical protein [Bacilli bacterium]
MQGIYPKIDVHLKGIHTLKKCIDKYKGLELQCIDFDKQTGYFYFEEEVKTMEHLFPNLKEITIHPPTEFCDLEMFCCQKEDTLLEIIEQIKTLSEELDIHINLVLHTHWNLNKHQMLTVPTLQKVLNSIKGYNVYILLENMRLIEEEKCTVLDLCKFMGDAQLKVCLDITHIKQNALFKKMEFNEYIKSYLCAKECTKYVHQVHFAAPGGMSMTEGIMHQSRKELIDDVELLYAYGMYACPFVTAIYEENIDERKDQLQEIDALEDIYKLMQAL